VIRRLILILIKALALPWKFVPSKARKKFFLVFFLIESRTSSPKLALASLFQVEDLLELVINERALASGGGEHPKHKLMPYHQFFIDHIPDSARVIDIGCGYGAVARSIAEAKPNCHITGIENNRERFQQATQTKNPNNLDFVFGDLYELELRQSFDVVILSNVLEHLHNRVDALKQIVKSTNAKRILIRVPSFERSWKVPMRKSLGICYFQDDDHKIEHTLAEFHAECQLAGLKIVSQQTSWGEIWAECLKS
jgi:SAM-dependent methyltransferase